MAKKPIDNDSGPNKILLTELREWLEPLDAVLELDLEALEEEYGNIIPANVNLQEYLRFAPFFEIEDIPFFPLDVEGFAEAYTTGVLAQRRRLRLKYATYFHLDPVSALAMPGEYLVSIVDSLDTGYFGDADGDEWRAYIACGLTPFAFGIIRDGHLDRHVCPACTPFDAILVVEHDKRAEDSSIDEVAGLFLFELSATQRITFKVSDYLRVFEDDELLDAAGHLPSPSGAVLREIRISDGPGLSALAEMWLRAAQADDPAVAFIQFVRCIEYVAATVVRRQEHESLRTYMLSHRSPQIDASFLDGAISLAEQYAAVKRRDKEMVKAAVAHCVVPEALPSSFARAFPKAASRCGGAPRAEQVGALKEIAEVLYDTRNSLVHAKPNYTWTGRELSDISEDVLESLGSLALMCIRWFSQQPEHARIT